MAIYKGQLMNQETKDILYPQTSTDMVDGLEELLEQAVIDNMTPPVNKLVNGDFQINQRGQTSYVNSTSTPIYTLDMWQLAYGTINVLDNGIKITPYVTQAFLNQKISDDLTDKQVTLVLKETNGEMHILQGVANKTQALSSKSGNVTLSIGYISETNLYKIGTTYDAETFVEYINLFEGDIVYPHVKEDEDIALLRCQGKVYKGVLYALPYGIFSGTQYWFQGVTNFPVEMDSIPTITYESISVANVGFLASDKILSIATSNKYLGKIMKIDVGMQIEANSYIRNPMLIDFIASCEPL